MIFESLYTSDDYLKHSPDWHAGVSPVKVVHILHMLARTGLTPQTVADVGCGVGEILAQLQTRMDSSCRFWGYDIAPQAIAQAKKKENEHLHFTLADFTQIDTSFDLVLLIDMIEHVENCFHLLRHVRARSKYIMIQFSLDLTVGALLRPRTLLGFRSTHGHVGHLHYFTKNIALAMLEDLGYEIVEAVYTPEPVPATSFSGKGLSLVRKGLYALNKDTAVRLLGGHKMLVLAKSKQFGEDEVGDGIGLNRI
jgi:SAM-dependent methyltransferase